MRRRRPVSSSSKGTPTLTTLGGAAPRAAPPASPNDAATLPGLADTAPQPEAPRADVDPSSSRRVLPSGLYARFKDPELLGMGGMGAVYRARDSVLGRDVALKLLHAGNPHLDETLFREARSQAKLEHENVCKVYEVGAEGDRRYLVMQLINGEPLDQAKKGMTLEQKVRIIRKIASALHEVHRQGFVHRDIKPSNIMVELVDEGIYKPYLMDFGLARETGAEGKTVTGIIAGTPAFMAPEQARGEIRKLDRRTDVYSLGASLYDLLAGGPPFDAPDLWRLINKIQTDDAPSLRSVNKDIPADLDAAVIKCLEKEPGRRYESAKAFGDDLQRFLDGEPVRARQASIAYVVFKKAKRNKPAVALIAVVLSAALALTAGWVRSQRAAEEQATFSRELGEDIKEMELFMRAAHELPTHDIEREHAIMRARLSKIKQRMSVMGSLGAGPGHYALGRGHLALQELEAAREHLEKATLAGYASPELDYAMGIVLGELYRRGLEEIKRIESPEKRKARLDELNASLKEPALRRLNASLEGEVSSHAYVKGLIALYSESYEQARAHAKEAFEQAPWLYEAKKLEADAYFAEGSKYRHDAAFDYEKMMSYFKPAADAFGEAAEIGRSDPHVFLSACEFWRQMLTSSPNTFEAASPIFNAGAATCGKSVETAPRAVEPRVQTALLYQAWSHKLLYFGERTSPDDVVKFQKEGAAKSREAVLFGPNDPMAHYVYGTALLNQVYYNNDRGLDSVSLVTGAIDSLAKAAELDPTFLWAHNELCKALGEKVHLLSVRGRDPEAALSGAVVACDHASALEPTWAFPYLAKAQAHLYMALDKAQYGAVGDADFDAIFQNLEEAKRRSPNLAWIYAVAARSYYHKARCAISRGDDPRGSLALADRAIEDFRRISPGAKGALVNAGLLATLRAHVAARGGEDPGPLVAEARATFEEMLKGSPWDIDYRVHRARPEVVALEWAIQRGEARAEPFDEALALLLPLLTEERAHPEYYQKLAEIYALKAEWLLSRKKSPAEAVQRGLEMAEKAIAIHPRMAAAFEMKGRLFTALAASLRSASEKAGAEAQAQEAFQAAIKLNPSLKQEVERGPRPAQP